MTAVSASPSVAADSQFQPRIECVGEEAADLRDGVVFTAAQACVMRTGSPVLVGGSTPSQAF
jgi:hypothetical protein